MLPDLHEMEFTDIQWLENQVAIRDGISQLTKKNRLAIKQKNG